MNYFLAHKPDRQRQAKEILTGRIIFLQAEQCLSGRTKFLQADTGQTIFIRLKFFHQADFFIRLNKFSSGCSFLSEKYLWPNSNMRGLQLKHFPINNGNHFFKKSFNYNMVDLQLILSKLVNKMKRDYLYKSFANKLLSPALLACIVSCTLRPPPTTFATV